ncbi:alpha-(1-_3)-arabinofuranosyltransferase domain-containing protein [Williamsia sp. MIQD14]|uniref:alpha-(1->3)-arabinofuranosyltransferase domain-containing protein n=1 Tax=Williamsia sp. MIQD14 TaxID=3425703 RepID=UPI003DA18907
MVADRLSRRGVALVALVALLASFVQSPGDVSADTKLDLTADPLGFLSRATHLWSSVAPMGQVQNQAYGYFFPHGAFFVLGDVIGLPGWVTQRLWWALLLTVGFVGVVRLAEALGIGSRGSRLFAATAFVVSPRVPTTIGSISSETLPMMLAPWVLIPVVIALGRDDHRGSLRQLAFRSACAVALMGAVNAVATAAACAAAVLWWALHVPTRRAGAARWARFTGWWALGVALACAWWVVPLLILSRVSPPFLDFIESSRVTTRWTSLTEVLRGTSSWTPFVSPDRVAGSLLVSSPVAVLATGVVAAAGLAGLAMRSMPARGRLITLAVVGLVIMGCGWSAALGSPVADQVRAFLDGAGAPLRNIHKFDPLIRIPIVLGIAHLLARVPLPGAVPWRAARTAFAHPERSRPVAATMVLTVVLFGAGSLVITGQLAPSGTVRATPDHWPQTAAWLREHSGDRAHPTRALVVPGAPFAVQTWGLTRDEPLQPLATTPWAVRDAIPLVPPGAIRAMDSVQRQIASGRGSPGLAATLAQQGIGYVVLRADLAPIRSRSARPIVARAAITASPGLSEVAEFGPLVGPGRVKGVVGDDGLIPPMRAIEIYRVSSTVGFDGTAPGLVDLAAMPRVVGGPESLARLQEHAARTGAPAVGPTLLDADARRAGVDDTGAAGAIVTDTPADREVDFGRVDDHSSAIRAPGDPRRTQNTAPDYPVPGAGLVRGQWLLDGRPDAVSVTASGSASDATQLGQTLPANSPAAAFDDDANTSWVSRGLDAAVGQWLQVDFPQPRSNLSVTITPGQALGPAVTGLLITTDSGTSVAQGISPGQPVTVVAPSGPTRSLQVRAISTENGTAGSQFAIAELALADTRTGAPLAITHRVVLPTQTAGRAVAQWDLGQDLPGRTACAPGPDLTRCSSALALSPEEPGLFSRVLSVPTDTTVTPRVWLRGRPGTPLNTFLTPTDAATATGASAVPDQRASAAAVVDGDPGTTWIAPDSSTRPGSPPASVRIELPAPRLIDSLTITRPRGLYPAAPRRVAIDLGTGRQVRTVPADGRIRLSPARASVVTVTVLDATDLVDVNSLGFAATAPVGIAEISLGGPDGATMPVASPDRLVRIGCAAGLTMSLGSQTVPLSVTTTARQLVAGTPVAATVCGSGRPLAVRAGEQAVSVNPSGAFTVDSVTLTAAGSATPAPASDRLEPVATGTWSADHRTATVDASPRPRVLVVPESENSGWRASLDGRRLSPIVVNGWQQGWIVPAGLAGSVTLDYPLDTPYRLALLLGLVAVAVLFALTAIPSRRGGDRADPLSVGRPPRAPVLAGVATAAAVTVLSGGYGLLVGVVVAAGVLALRRRRPRTVPVAVAAAFTLAAAGLSLGPWGSGDPYTGFDWWVTVPALAAVVALMTVVAVPERAFSQARRRRRAGSSTSP